MICTHWLAAMLLKLLIPEVRMLVGTEQLIGVPMPLTVTFSKEKVLVPELVDNKALPSMVLMEVPFRLIRELAERVTPVAQSLIKPPV